MPSLVDRLMQLWLRPLPEGAEAEAAFRAVYADPVRVNGVDMTVSQLVQRARALQAAFGDLQVTIDRQVEAPGTSVIGFRMHGRHVGPLQTPLGVVPATGREVEVRTIDILTVRDNVVTEVFVVGDELGRLVQLGALALAGPPG